MRVRHFNVNPMACRYQYNNDLSTYTPNGYVFTNTPPQTGMGYDISADYVDSTTAYDPRPASSTQLDQIADSALIPASNNTGEFSLSTEPAHLCVRVRVRERQPARVAHFPAFCWFLGHPPAHMERWFEWGRFALVIYCCESWEHFWWSVAFLWFGSSHQFYWVQRVILISRKSGDAGKIRSIFCSVCATGADNGRYSCLCACICGTLF